MLHKNEDITSEHAENEVPRGGDTPGGSTPDRESDSDESQLGTTYNLSPEQFRLTRDPRTTFEMLVFRWAGLRVEFERIRDTATSMDLNYLDHRVSDAERRLVSEAMRWV